MNKFGFKNSSYKISINGRQKTLVRFNYFPLKMPC